MGLRFVDTLAGRLALVLTVGGTLAAVLAFALAQYYRDLDIHRYRAEQLATGAADVAARLSQNYVETHAALRTDRILGVRLVESSSPVLGWPDATLNAALIDRFPASSAARGMRADPSSCFTGPAAAAVRRMRESFPHRPAGLIAVAPECWVIGFTLRPGGQRVLISLMMPTTLPASTTVAFKPTFLIIIIGTSFLLSLAVAHVTLGFMRRLTLAARAFGSDIHAGEVAETGPRDVRETFAAFNAMQQRVRATMEERTQILAAVSHDLQTPLTRLRLRLESVNEVDLQHRLIADVKVMQQLVAEGLALARASDTTDEWASIDLPSLLVSTAEDAIDEGKAVTVGPVEPIVLRIRPNALIRSLQNLIDNAVLYGRSAEIGARLIDGRVVISVADDGPGLKEDDIERMFEPFVRGEVSRSRKTGGTGIGLTIARRQAETFGGKVELANGMRGGLIATITINLRGSYAHTIRNRKVAKSHVAMESISS